MRLSTPPNTARAAIPHTSPRFLPPPKGRVDDLAAAIANLGPIQQGDRVNGGGCYGSVLLDNELRQSLSAMNGLDVPWVHGCVLDHGHEGDHGATAYQVDGGAQYWLRWPDHGPAHLERVELSPPGRHSSSLSAPPLNPPPPSTTVGEAGPDDVAFQATNSHTDALWAISAALERIADAVTRLGNSSRDDRPN